MKRGIGCADKHRGGERQREAELVRGVREREKGKRESKQERGEKPNERPPS